MIFNSFEYVLFLWAVFVLYWSLGERLKLRYGLLLAASYWFYAQADWRFTSLLLVSSVTDYVAGAGVQRAKDAGRKGLARAWLWLSLAVNLGMLGFFKYFDFFVESFEQALGRAGLEASLWHLDLVVPVGISFYTFQTLSYTLDIHRGNMKPIRGFLEFALYVSFFPQLVAGPIVRARTFLPQLARPGALTSERVGSGLYQILRGMTKKIVVADIVAVQLVDPVYANAESLEAAGGPAVLLATYAYTLQIWADFAGYSDIAIGSARLFGFEVPKNFDSPYRSRSLEEFWNRWHISMSSWFVDYVYQGIARATRKVRRGASSLPRIAANITVTWALIGLWHGAAWTFVLWGLYHAFWLVVSRVVRSFLPKGRFPDHAFFGVAGWLFTFHVVVAQTLFFRAPSFDAFRAACAALTDWSAPLPTVQPLVWVLLLAGFGSHFLPDRWSVGAERGFVRAPRLAQAAAVAAAILLFFSLRPPGLAPFIYFQF